MSNDFILINQETRCEVLLGLRGVLPPWHRCKRYFPPSWELVFPFPVPTLLQFSQVTVSKFVDYLGKISASHILYTTHSHSKLLTPLLIASLFCSALLTYEKASSIIKCYFYSFLRYFGFQISSLIIAKKAIIKINILLIISSVFLFYFSNFMSLGLTISFGHLSTCL